MEKVFNTIEDVSLLKLIRDSAKTNDQILGQIKFLRDVIARLDIAIFIHDLTKLRHIWTNNNYVSIIGYTDAEIKTFGPEWAKDNYHPDDFHILKERIEYFRQNKGDTYAGIYRVKHKLGHWVWVYSNSTVFKRDEDGTPIQIIGISIDFTKGFKTGQAFDAFHHERQQQLNQNILARLTRRETEILRLITAGKKDSDIADALKISMHTVHSHRKNLLSKLKVHSNVELVCFAIKCGLD